MTNNHTFRQITLPIDIWNMHQLYWI